MIIKSKRIVSEQGMIDGYLEVKGRIIKDIKLANVPMKCDLDVGNNRILPGFFDTHNHGTMGYSVMKNSSEKEIKGYLKGLASQGVTSVFPTCDITIIKTLAKMSEKEQDGAKIVGIHSEGPWLNRVGEKGIKTGYPKVDIGVAQKMITDGQGKLKLVAIAPEIPGVDKLIELFLKNGIKVAFAHSDDNYEEANKHLSQGIHVATHLCNVMSGIHHRDIGGLGACLLHDEVACELICDGMHVSLPMIQLIMKTIRHDRIMMISDCTPMSGAPVGVYSGFGLGMEKIHVNEEGFVLSDTGRLCGSSKGIIYGVKELVEKLHVPIEEVVQLSSLHACKTYDLAKQKGSLKVGKDADFVIINDEYEVLSTYSEGRKIYDCTIDKEVFNPTFISDNLKLEN